MTLNAISAADISGLVGIIPTPALPGADSPAATRTVNLPETERMVSAVVDAGVDILLTNGTFGEISTLTSDEILEFADVVIRTVGDRIPVFVGATGTNTRDTIARASALLGLGAQGLFLGRPMWLPLDDRQLVDYYGAVAAALPQSTIVVYDNPAVFKGKISPRAYAELSRIPQIVAAKHTGGSVDVFRADLDAVDGRMALLPLADNWLPMAQAFPGRVPAAWSGDIACGPEPAVALRTAMAHAFRTGDWAEAEAVHHDIEWAVQTLFPEGDIAKFMPYSIQIDRAKFEAAGFVEPGPGRHPYSYAPPAHLEGGREVGRRWATLRDKYRS